MPFKASVCQSESIYLLGTNKSNSSPARSVHLPECQMNSANESISRPSSSCVCFGASAHLPSSWRRQKKAIGPDWISSLPFPFCRPAAFGVDTRAHIVKREVGPVRDVANTQTHIHSADLRFLQQIVSLSFTFLSFSHPSIKQLWYKINVFKSSLPLIAFRSQDRSAQSISHPQIPARPW